MDKEDETPVEKLKEKYAVLEKKYSLPGFDELNRDFSIEKAEKDSDFILREIVHLMVDKFQNYIRFLENLINPSNASLFAFNLMKIVDSESKTKFSEAYKKLSEIEMNLIKLDIKPSEELEAKFIKDSYGKWKEIQKELYEVIEYAEKNWNNKHEQSNKGYFG